MTCRIPTETPEGPKNQKGGGGNYYNKGSFDGIGFAFDLIKIGRGEIVHPSLPLRIRRPCPRTRRKFFCTNHPAASLAVASEVIVIISLFGINAATITQWQF